MVVLSTVHAPIEGNKEEGTKIKELAILKLGQVLASNNFAEGKYAFVCIATPI